MEPSTNPNPLTSAFQSNNFEVKLALNDTQLMIDAEDSSLRHFHFIITPEHVKELTSDIFEDLQFLYESLLEAFEGKDPSIKVDISDDGKLIYSEEQVRRGMKRVKNFTLTLKEEIIDEAKRQGRRLDLQASKIGELEARIAKLEQENNKLRSDSEKALIEKIEKVEKVRIPEMKEATNEIVNKLEESFGKKFKQIEQETIPQIKEAIEKTLQDFERRVNLLDIEKRIDQKLLELKSQTFENENVKKNEISFDTTCPHAQAGKFLFSNDNKTITYQGSSTWNGCFAKHPLQKQQRTQFSVKADSITSNAYVMIGICPSNLKSSTSVYSCQGVYCYYGHGSGSIRVNGQGTNFSNSTFKTGSMITIAVDLLNYTINFELNGKSIYNSNLDSSMISSYDYYPFVELYEQNDKVSFI